MSIIFAVTANVHTTFSSQPTKQALSESGGSIPVLSTYTKTCLLPTDT